MKRNILLIFAGIFLAFVLLEIALRCLGAFYLFLEESANHISSDQREIRVLCLGESTTAGGEYSYPRQLQVLLNSIQREKTFSVINKGIPGITTDTIIDHLKDNLNEYKPHVVVVMMGINDDAFYTQTDSSVLRFFNHFHTFKLLRLLSRHMKSKFRGHGATVDKNTQEVSEFELKKEAQIRPLDYHAWLNLGLYYKDQASYSKAIEVLNKALSLAGADSFLVQAVIEWALGECYKNASEYPQAIDAYKKVLMVIPQHSRAWADLAEVYIRMQDFATAETLLARQIVINAHEARYYGLLMRCYKHLNQSYEIEPMLQVAIGLNPGNLDLYQMLGYFLMDQKEYLKAEIVFNQMLALDPVNRHNLNNHLLKQLEIIYDRTGQPQKAALIQQKFNFELHGYSNHTWGNYRTLIEEIQQRGIPLIIMQYPMRDPQPLKDYLGDKSITYVDNRTPFDKIKELKGFDYLFVDHFAGDFGHCTSEGNKLLAQNAAAAVLQRLRIP